MTSVPHPESLPVRHEVSVQRACYEVYRILQWGFVAVPIIAGLDKFFYVLTDWSQYVAPWAARIVGGNVRTAMMVVGIIEIIAGIGVAIKPRYFGFVACAWLCCIIINLLTKSGYYDIALRDFGLAVAAFCLGLLAMVYDHGNFGGLMRNKMAPPLER
jgi:uncharacterized membrane protein